MNLKKALTKDTICLDLKGRSKTEIIEEMVDLLAAAGRIKNRKSALKAVLEREKKMSTGMQNGIAIPHGKTDSVDSFAAALALHKDGVDFDALDGQPAHIFVMTISPAKRTGPHIQFLAEISRLLHDDAIRTRVLNAESSDDILNILRV